MQARTTDGGPTPVAARSRWTGPVAVGLAAAGILVLTVTTAAWIGLEPAWAYDFRAYFDAALRLLASGSPYQAETLGGPFRPGPGGLYLYSPLLAVALVPLTALSEETAALVWLVLHIGALGLACAAMPVPGRLRLATFGVAALSAPVLDDLRLGNVSLIVTLLAVAAWRWLDRPLGSICVAMSLAIRPTMGMLGAWWLLRGVWRPAVWTALAAIVLFLVTLPLLGIGAWADYLVVLRNIGDVTGVPRNVDLGSAVLLVGGPEWLAPLALFAGYAVSVAAILLSLRRDRELSFVVTLTSTLLLAPLLWGHYLTLLIVPAAFLASRGLWLGLALPVLGWLPVLLVAVFPTLGDGAEAILPLVVLAGVLLPFAAQDRGQRAGFLPVGQVIPARA